MSLFPLFLNFLMFFNLSLRQTEHEQGRGRERGRDRIWSRLQALSCQHRVWCGARTNRVWDHDLSWSRTINRLSHPGAPFISPFLIGVYLSFNFLNHLEPWAILNLSLWFLCQANCCFIWDLLNSDLFPLLSTGALLASGILAFGRPCPLTCVQTQHWPTSCWSLLLPGEVSVNQFFVAFSSAIPQPSR